jgi:hypothetical protein
MVRFAIALFALFSVSVLADVNSDVQDCLKSKGAGGKTGCVQGAIDKEEQNQIQKLFNVYSNFVSNEINSGNFGAPQTGPSTSAPATPTTGPQPPSSAPPPPPVSQPIKPGSQPTKPGSQGEIKYF